MKRLKLIVIWGIDNILSTYLEGLLAGKEDWKVIHIANQRDLDAFAHELSDPRYQIIFIGMGSHAGLQKLALAFIQAHQDIRVIMISYDSNCLDVYNKQHFDIKDAAELISVIENETSIPGGLGLQNG